MTTETWVAGPTTFSITSKFISCNTLSAVLTYKSESFRRETSVNVANGVQALPLPAMTAHALFEIIKKSLEIQKEDADDEVKGLDQILKTFPK
jgi:hypothetical protein